MDWKTWWRNLTVNVTLTDWLLMFFTFALTLLGAVQACEIHRQGNDTHTLAVQAVAQTRVAAETFSLAYRPNIEAQKAVLIQQNGGAVVYVTLVHSGTQSARDVKAFVQDGHVSKSNDQSGTVFSPGRTTVLQLTIGKLQMRSVFSGEQRLIINGAATFREVRPADDPRGDAPTERTCFRFVYDPVPQVFSPNIGC